MPRPKAKPTPVAPGPTGPDPTWFRGTGEHYTPDEKQAIKLDFLTQYANTGSSVMASRGAGVSRRVLYIWRKDDPEFDAVWKEVQEGLADRADATMFRRGMDDNYDPRASTQSLLAYLNAHHPNYTYREKNGQRSDGGPQITVNITYVERPPLALGVSAELGNLQALPNTDEMISIAAHAVLDSQEADATTTDG